MQKREFHLQDDQSNKYWTIEVVGNATVTTNGRIGAKPRETRTAHATPEAALREAEKEVLAKRRKGYIEGPLDAVPAYVPGLPPRFVRINHDDYHAKYVGKTGEGDQFFLTFPFVPHTDTQPGVDYIALYMFDEFGILKASTIVSEQAQGLKTQTEVGAFVETLLQGLGTHRFADIRVAPFAINHAGQVFGLVFDPGEPDDDDPYVCVTAEPGDYMAFNPPWDGDYDT